MFLMVIFLCLSLGHTDLIIVDPEQCQIEPAKCKNIVILEIYLESRKLQFCRKKISAVSRFSPLLFYHKVVREVQS